MKTSLRSVVAFAALSAALPAFADDPFAIKDPFTARAIFSCGDFSMSGGSVDSAGFTNGGTTNRGHVASNGRITLSGSSVIDGDATPGPGKTVTTSGSARVTGSKTPATAAIGCTPVDLAALAATLQSSNDNSRITLTGQGKNPLSGANHTVFSMSGGDTITLPAGTYYFSSFSLSGGSTVTLAGPVRILCTGSMSLSGGSINNAAGGAGFNPYRLRFWSQGTVSLSSSTMAAFVYAPAGSVSLSSAQFNGGIFANAVSISGSSHVTRSLDDAAPSVAITSPADGAVVSDPAHVDVRGTASDGQTTVTLQVNGQPVTIAADGTFQTTVNLTGVNPPTITATVTDAARNTASAHVTVTTTPPPVLSLTAPAPGSYVNARIINLSGGSGNATTVTVNGRPATINNGTWSLSGFDLGPDGPHTLTIVGTNAGGSSTITPVITSDTVPPSIQAAISPAPNAAGWNRTDVTIHFTCSDAGSGIATCPADVVVTTEGANQAVTRSAVDRANNSTPATVAVSIDKTAPTVAVTAPQNNQVVSDPHLVVTGTAGDAVSVKVNAIAATIDPAAHTFTSAPLNLLEAKNDIAVVGTDIAGNAGTATVSVNLDTRAPELTVTAPVANACLGATSVTVTGRAKDAHLDKVNVSLGGGAAIAATVAGDGTWTAAVTLPDEGRAVINVEATDTAGHTATAALPILVDRTKPSVQITVNGAPFGGGAFNRSLTPIIRATDADPAAALSVTLNGNAYISGTEIAADGTYTLRATARDCAGNVSDEASAQFVIDTAPLKVLSFDPADGSTIGAPRAIVGTVDADDLKSATIEGTTTTAAISGRTFTFNVPLAEGNNQFVIDVVDNAGNVTQQKYSVRVKSSTPAVEITESGLPIAPNALFNRIVTPVIRSNEPNATIAATLGTQPYASGTPVSGDGAYTLSATATDVYGHVSAPATATFSIDRTPPTVTINAVVSGDHADVSGTVGGGDVDRVAINNILAAVTGGGYSASIPLEIGRNTLVATAVDHAGNAATASIDVTRDDNKPGLILTSPENGTTTNRPTTVVAGQLLTLGTGAKVAINGLEVVVDANGAFRKTDFALSEGDNAITAATVFASGAGGTARAVTVHVIADFTPPALKVLANGVELTAGARVATSPQITLQTEAGAVTKLSVDGIVITGATPALADGGHALTATARDSAGNEARADFIFFVGAATSAGGGCALSKFDPPNNAAVFADSVTISGLSGGAAAVLVNGARAQVAGGSFNASVALTQERANSVTIACADANGVATNDPAVTLTIYRYTSAPAVTIDALRPPTGSGTTITVTGTVGEGVVSGDVNGIGFTPAGGVYAVPNVALSKGLNVITARARYSAGRIGVATAIITLAGPTPQVNITSPLTATQTGAATVDVTGTYIDADPARITVTAGGTSYTATTKPLGDTTGTFTVPSVALAPNATTTITATAFGAMGAQAQMSVDVANAGGTPSISIDAPTDNTFYRADQQSPDAVSGSVSPIKGSVVQVNGVQATVDASFHFSATVPFSGASNGVTPVVARVTAPDGKSASDSIRIVHFAGPLAVTDTFPAASAAGVDIGAVLVTLFSNPIDAGSAHDGALSLADDAGATITGTAYVDKDAVSFAPNVPLAAGRRYTLTVSQALKDLAGGALAAPFALSFTTAAGAPDHAPIVNEPGESGCLSRETITGKASIGSAKVRLDVDGVSTSTVSAGDGTFRFELTLSGAPGYHIARVREVGADGTLSPEHTVTYYINCAALQVLGATLDRAAKRLSIQFSGSVTPSTLVAAPGGTVQLGALSGTVALNASNDLATVTYDADLSTGTFLLTVRKEVKDAAGAPMAADFTQTFAVDSGITREKGKGYISGAVYDESTGRPLAGASVSIVPSADPAVITQQNGRYARLLPEGAYTIEAGAAGYTTVWRQVIVPAGVGIVPIDIRLARRGPEKPSGGALALSHVADSVTRQVDLAIPSAALAGGHNVALTSVGAQSLAGLLPLGWSPLAAAEIAVDRSGMPAPIPGSALTFTLTDADVAAITAAAQTLSVVQYDPARDEWRVVVAVAAIANKRVAADIITSGNYALVYPDKAANLALPPAPHAGAVLMGVANPCTAAADACAMTKRRFDFDPPQVAPSGKSLATLITDGTTKPFPSGTAVQAYIDEQLNLTDGRVEFDPPFATDLLVYRSLAGDDGVAMFHVAPTSRAAAATLRDGVDHVRVVDYPGRIDRGTLIGSEGGRVPGDDSMSIDIPTGATQLALHASVTPMGAAELAPFVDHIAGFHVAGGFTFALTRSDNPPPVDLNGDGIPDVIAVSLLKPARGTFTVDASKVSGANRQMIIAEVLGSTPFGAMVRLAAPTSTAGGGVFTTSVIDPAQLPVDGIVRDGRYLILTADAPVAFAWGLVRSAAGGPILANARVTAPPLGVPDLTRLAGTFAVPVPAKPAAPFSLRAATPSRGEGSPAVYPSSPDPGQSVRLDLVLDAQPPHLISITPTGEIDSAQPLLVRATFDADIDRATVAGGIAVSDLTGTVDAAGKIVTFTPTQPPQPGVTYTITVSPTIRGTNGAPFGQGASAQFRTRAIPSSTANVDPKKIRITLPNNGVSIISGTAGALPPGANALAVRRGRNFFTQYQATVSGDGAFSFAAGSVDESDRITVDDLIDLQVIDAVSHSVIAEIPLTPFVTAEGDGFLAPVGVTSTFTTAAGIGVTIPAGAFYVPTVVRANPAAQSVFQTVPSFDEELHYTGGVSIDFDGVAKQRLEIDVPAAVALDPNKLYYLGRLIDTVRGPRIELDDTLRIDGNKLTTTLPPGGAAAPSRLAILAHGPRAMGIPGITTAGEVKQAMLGVVQRGNYTTVNVIPPVGWMYTLGLGEGLDIFISTVKAVAISGFWLSQKSGKAFIPVAAGVPFIMEGVDEATGVSVFKKPYDVQIPVGDPLSGVIVPSPTAPTRGPYPTFAALGRVEVIDVNTAAFTDESRTGLIISFDGTINQLTVKPAAVSTALKQPLELLNVTSGAFQSTASFETPLPITAEKGQRVVILAGVPDVDPLANIGFAFSEPLGIDPLTLASFFEIKLADSNQDVTAEAKFTMDSGNRRVTATFPVGLQRGKRYRITMKSTITGSNPSAGGALLGLGQVQDPGVTPPLVVAARDLHVEFTTRGPGGDLGSFQIKNPFDPSAGGTARDFALDGNILFIAGTNAGLLAYDVSDPAALTQPTAKPFAWAPANPNFSETWSVATDKHGRVWTTGMTSAFGFIRAYTTDGFIDAPNGKTVSACGPTQPSQCPEPPLRGSLLVSYRPGYVEMLPLPSSASGFDSGITTTLTTKPEAIPRKLQIVEQDRDTSMTTAALIGASGTPPVPPAPIPGTDFVKITTTVPFDTQSKYWIERVTFRNVTLGMQWSKDIVPGQSATFVLVGRMTDQWLKSVNLSTYGVVSLFGFGIGTYDLNALESNRWTGVPPIDPTIYKAPLEQVLISDAKFQAQCIPPDPAVPFVPFTCNANQQAALGLHCPVPDLQFSPDSIVLPGAPPKMVVYGLNVRSGLVDFRINPPATDPLTTLTTEPTCDKRAGGLTLSDKVPWPSDSSGLVEFDHPRLNRLRKIYMDEAKKLNPAAPPPFARFSSMALYVRSTPAAPSAPAGTPPTLTNYALIAAADYGLLVVKLDPTTDLDNNSLVDVVWVPSGAYSVRIVPGAQLATVTDGAGRILIVDLTGVDESALVPPLTPSDCGNPDACLPELFPSARNALKSPAAAPLTGQNWTEVGADDARIIWKSRGDPADLTRSTLAPVIDGETGILYKGDFLDPKVKIVAAADPRIRFLADIGNPKGPTDMVAITPMGINPPASLLKCTPGPACNASAAAFRLEVALPGALAESLPGGELRVALESETFPTVAAPQTIKGFPRAHLRAATIEGTADPRAATEFKLRRVIPAVADPLIQRLRYQKAYNHFQSPWVLTLADPRASAKYIWNTADKAAKGCYSCDRPASLAGKKEPELFELYTAGRFLHVRPEYNNFAATPYAYLGEKGRMETRVDTVMADTIHPPDIAVAAQNPPVAGGAVQETIYLHSGEVETSAIDLDVGGRAGWDVLIDRTYRSRTIGASPLGFGWDSAMFARLREMPDGTVEYRDGSGEVWVFARVGTAAEYLPAGGLLAKLIRDPRGWRVFHQGGSCRFFDSYGRMIALSDRFIDPLRALDGGTNEGNVLRYFYDAQGRLGAITDPVGRTTRLQYYLPTDPDTPGLLKETTDWRQRKTTYEYDDHRRLHFARLAEAANPAASSFALTGGNRPFLKYGYSGLALAPDTDQPAQAYDDFLELAPNLEAITDPAEAAGANASTERVKFHYIPGIDPDQRDRIDQQIWPCADVTSTGTCAPRTASFTLPASLNASVTDILGQVRQYQIVLWPADKRHHVVAAQEIGVPVVAAASGALPSTVSATYDPQSETKNLIFGYAYNELGQATTVTGPGFSQINGFDFLTGSGSVSPVPGKVLKSSITTTSGGAPVITEYVYDPAAREPELSTTKSNAVPRQTPTAHRQRHVIQRTETGSAVVTSATRVDDAGVPIGTRTYPGSVAVPDDLLIGESLPAGATRVEDRTVYPATAAEPARGRYHTIKSTGSTDIEITYGSAASGGDVQTVEEKARTPHVITRTTRDSMDRVIEIEETSGSGALDHEKFGYDASGRLLYHSRAQLNVGEVVERFTYDPLGRQLSRSIDHATVAGAPGQEVKTTTGYDLTNRKITTVHPPNSLGVSAQTVTSLDPLGRAFAVETGAPNTPSTRRVLGYDLLGILAYRSDSARSALLMQHDALGRETVRLSSDGIKTTTSWSPWNEPTEETSEHSGAVVAHATYDYAPQGTPLRTNVEIGTAIAGSGGSPLIRSVLATWTEGAARIGARIGSAISMTGLPTPVPDLFDVRQSESTYDPAGRVILSRVSSGGIAGMVFRDSGATAFDGDLPTTVADSAPLRGPGLFQSTVGYDAHGNATSTNAAGGYNSTAEFDQLGNVVRSTPPGLGEHSATYDSRGLLTSRTVPDPAGPKTRVYEYDAQGALTRFQDESGLPNETKYERDALGRVTKIAYPDTTFEQTTYEDGTGLVKATRDRAGQWLSYNYDSGNRLTEIHRDLGPAAPLIVRYDYDLLGHRLHRIANVNAAVEYEDYDLVGRPRITRAVRYAPGGNLADPTTLVPSDIHVQQHVWSVFGMERTRYRMPAAGHDVPPTEPASQWRSWIDEQRDAGGNLTRLTATSAATGFSSSSDFVIATATPAGAGELLLRTRNTTAGTPVASEYGYNDGPVTLDPELGGTSAFSSQPASGELREVRTSRGSTTTLAGTSIFHNTKALIAAQRDLALGSRGSLFDYDARGRVKTTGLHVRTNNGIAATAAPKVTDVLSPADFRGKRVASVSFTASEHTQLGDQALTIEPPTWQSSPKPSQQIDVRQLLLDGTVKKTFTYAFDGGRRKTDGVWTSTYDELGRLTQIDDGKRRIVATYDPLDRLVARSAYYFDGSNWIPEDRQATLDEDGLPANATFVWDPISDRLLEIARSGDSAASGAAPHAGLVRQYVHGDQGYDDPVEVIAFDRTATPTVRRLLPVIDEVGTGSLEAVLDGANGNVVERVLYGDAYGDAPRYLQGPVVDKIAAKIIKSGSALQKIEVRVHLTEKIDAASVGDGVIIRALDSSVNEIGPPSPAAVVDPDDAFTALVTLTAGQWQALQTTAGAATMRIAVTNTLRSPAWGNVPVSPAPPWTQTLYGVATTPTRPVDVRESIATLTDFIAAAPDSATTDYPTIYGLPNLYAAGVASSKTKLLTGWKSAPFVDPATGFSFFRARWYSPSDGNWLSPDPLGYGASGSNLYSFCGGDPVNCSDPTGMFGWRDVTDFWSAWQSLGSSPREIAKTVGRSAASLAGAVVSVVPGASQVIHETPQNIRRVKQAVAAYRQGGVNGVLQYNREESERIAASQPPISETVLNALPVVGTIRQAMTIPDIYYREGPFFGGMAVGAVTQRTMGDVALGAGAANGAGSYLLRDVEFSNPYSAPALASNPLLSEEGAAAGAGAGLGTVVPLNTAYHYTYRQYAAAIEQKGLRAGVYATTNGDLSPLQAQLELALRPDRALPEIRVQINLAGLRRAGYEIPGVTRVSGVVSVGDRVYTMPGGGYEMQFPYRVPPEFIKVIH